MRFLIVFSLLAACGGGSDKSDTTDDTDVVDAGPAGAWQVKKEWINQGSCQGKGEEAMAPTPWVQIVENASDIEVTFCAGETNCPPTPDWVLSPDGTTWLAELHDGYLSPEYGCAMFYIEQTAEIVDGELTLDEHKWQIYDASITGERDCNNEIPEFFGSGGECTDRRLITAAKP